jgi:IclR family acetate operon transcriptional repressor
VRAARKRGFSMIVEVFAPAMSAIAAPLAGQDGQTIGVITIAGPLVRLSEQRMLELGPTLLAHAREVSLASRWSGLFKKPRG